MLAVAFAAGLVPACGRDDSPDRVILATTTSVEDSGLLDTLIPLFQQQYPQYAIQYIAVGSGQALELGRRGDADVLITHSPRDEGQFMRQGHGLERRPLMRNSFVLVGPAADPAGVRQAEDIVDAFKRIAGARERFVSRGDDSGTHRKEREIWELAGVNPEGEWYLEAGVGMGDALRIASERQACVLTDDATWLFLRPTLELAVLSSGDSRLVNSYSVIRVARAGNPSGAAAFAEWITGADAQRAIGDFRRAELGEALFIPAAQDSTR